MEIRKVTQQIRRDFETGEVDCQLLLRLYEKYHHVPHGEIFVRKALSSFPRLNCGLASVYLRHHIHQGTIVRGKFKDHLHTFILLRNSIVLDITADQYGGPKIHVGKLAWPWALY